jgi:hypothetical protein
MASYPPGNYLSRWCFSERFVLETPLAERLYVVRRAACIPGAPAVSVVRRAACIPGAPAVSVLQLPRTGFSAAAVTYHWSKVSQYWRLHLVWHASVQDHVQKIRTPTWGVARRDHRSQWLPNARRAGRETLYDRCQLRVNALACEQNCLKCIIKVKASRTSAYNALRAEDRYQKLSSD